MKRDFVKTINKKAVFFFSGLSEFIYDKSHTHEH